MLMGRESRQGRNSKQGLSSRRHSLGKGTGQPDAGLLGPGQWQMGTGSQ